MNKKQWDYVLEYIDNVNDQVNQHEIKIQDLQDEIDEIKKVLSKSRLFKN